MQNEKPDVSKNIEVQVAQETRNVSTGKLHFLFSELLLWISCSCCEISYSCATDDKCVFTHFLGVPNIGKKQVCFLLVMLELFLMFPCEQQKWHSSRQSLEMR